MAAGDDAVNRVASYIMNSAEYDLNVSGFDTDDYAVYFLTEAKRGYCTHFATAAAVMYRALGIFRRVWLTGFAGADRCREVMSMYAAVTSMHGSRCIWTASAGCQWR